MPFKPDFYIRADAIEKIVQQEYCDEWSDAADLALDELASDPDRSDAVIAAAVAQRILQP